MAAWNEAPAAGGLGECAALVRSAEALRFSAPELAVQLARRALIVGAAEPSGSGDVGQAKSLSMRAQAVLAAGLVRMSHHADAVEPAFAALALAEGDGATDVAMAVRLDLAACTREVGEPLLGCTLLRPVLDTAQVRPSVRAVALGRLVGCIAHVGRRDDLEDALTEADRLLAADDELSPDGRRMERARLSVRAAAYHRWYGDTEDAADAAREGLTQLNRLRGRRGETERLRAQLVLELACALLDEGALEEAASVSEGVLADPVRATSAAAVGKLMIAVSTRVHLPAGRVERGRGLLDQAVWVADRHGLDGLLADALTVVSQLDETAERPAVALESLRAARAAEQRRLHAMAHAARHLLTETSPNNWDAKDVNTLLRKVVRAAGEQPAAQADWHLAAQRVTRQARLQAAPSEPSTHPNEQPTRPSDQSTPPDELSAWPNDQSARPDEPPVRSSEPSARSSEPSAPSSEQLARSSEQLARSSERSARTDELSAWPSEQPVRSSERAEWSSEQSTRPDGLPVRSSEPAHLSEQPVRSREQSARPDKLSAWSSEQPARLSEQSTRPSELSARPGEVPGLLGEQPARWSEQSARLGEQPDQSSEPPSRSGEQPARTGESPERPGEQPAAARAELSAGELVSATAERMHEQSETDAATGLLNKEGLIRRLRAVRNGERPVALTLVRLDGGIGPGRIADPGSRSAATDFELSELAGRVRNMAPEDAELARSDGAELAVMLPHTTRDQAEKLAARIESAWLGTANGHSISTGVVQSNPDAPTVDARALINAARHALTPAMGMPSTPLPPAVDHDLASQDANDTLRIGRAIISSLSIPTGSGGKRRAADTSTEDTQEPASQAGKPETPDAANAITDTDTHDPHGTPAPARDDEPRNHETDAHLPNRTADRWEFRTDSATPEPHDDTNTHLPDRTTEAWDFRGEPAARDPHGDTAGREPNSAPNTSEPSTGAEPHGSAGTSEPFPGADSHEVDAHGSDRDTVPLHAERRDRDTEPHRDAEAHGSDRGTGVHEPSDQTSGTEARESDRGTGAFGSSGQASGTEARESGRGTGAFGSSGGVGGVEARESGHGAGAFGSSGLAGGVEGRGSGHDSGAFGSGGGVGGVEARESGRGAGAFGSSGADVRESGGGAGAFGSSGLAGGAEARGSGHDSGAFGSGGGVGGVEARESGRGAGAFGSSGADVRESGGAAGAFGSSGADVRESGRDTGEFGSSGGVGGVEAPEAGRGSGMSDPGGAEKSGGAGDESGRSSSSSYEQTKAELALLMSALAAGEVGDRQTPLPAPSRPTEDHARNGSTVRRAPRQTIPTPPEPDDVPEPERRPDIPDPVEPEPIPPAPPDPGPTSPGEPGPLTPPSADLPRREPRARTSLDEPSADLPRREPGSGLPPGADLPRRESGAGLSRREPRARTSRLAAAFRGSDEPRAAETRKDKADGGTWPGGDTTQGRPGERSDSTTIAGLLAEALAAYQETSDEAEKERQQNQPAQNQPEPHKPDDDFDRLFDWRYQSPASGRHRSPE